MERNAQGFLKTPDRLSSTYAKGLIALSLIVLAIAALGPYVYEDAWHRAAYVVAMSSIGLGNLVWGIGSLLPEERGGTFFRNLSRPFFLVMIVALPIALYLQLRYGA